MDYSDRHNPQCVTEYISDIMCYLKDLETKQMPQADYIARQTEINERMRAILVDWLVEVHFKFKLRQETLFLTISIIDRFLSERIVTKQKLQLVGVTAMLLASKYEEIYAPEVRDFIYISARTYTRDEILKMERIMLSTLGFSLSHPTPYSFLARYKKVLPSPNPTLCLDFSGCGFSLCPEYTLIHTSFDVCAASALPGWGAGWQHSGPGQLLFRVGLAGVLSDQVHSLPGGCHRCLLGPKVRV